MSRARRRPGRRRLRVLVLLETGRRPPDDLEALSDQERYDFKMEIDVLTTLETLGHEAQVLEVKHELGPIRQALYEWKPHIVFNLIEAFFGLRELDQHVVSYLELLRVPYTGCNPRGLVLARDKALAKTILTYHRVPVPRFDVVHSGRRVRRSKQLTFPLIVKSLTEEASVGIAQASVVWDQAELDERVRFIHESITGDALIEEFIDGREIYVGVLGNKRLTVLPPWELFFEKTSPGAVAIATERVKHNLAYQVKHGITEGEADLEPAVRAKLIAVAKRIYRSLSLEGYARLDFRLRADGTAFFIEANPNPEIARKEEFAQSALKAGIKYERLIETILALGIRRGTM
ncbi:MAG: D-alanine--D-alanine ligase [Gemmatimonadetes bacterium]|nr:MAG: D-alanine--D-alanine ligase [Gemmatimonadota bacterium]